MNTQAHDSAKVSTSTKPPSQRGLHAFACVLVVLTVGLITAGAMVTSTGSGLSVPDWPTTYGQNMFLFPPSKWVGGIFYEHSHRLIAASIGFLTIILAFYAHFRGRTATIRALGWVALCAVVAQGILGGMTVKFMLPTWISVFHACLAQTFLCILVTIAILTHSRMETGTQRAPAPVGVRNRGRLIAPVILVAIVFAQLLAGALMRHTESGLAVPDFPLAYGQVVPDLSNKAIVGYNDTRAFDYQMNPVTPSQIEIHLVHRAGALLVVLAVIATAVSLWRKRNRDDVNPAARRTIVWIIGLVVVQVTLGAVTIWTAKMPAVATAHVAVGATILALSWRCFLLTRLPAGQRVANKTADHVGQPVAVSGALA